LEKAMWNWEVAFVVNVQILNSVAFESITGFAAPLCPISFNEYAKANIPFLTFDSADRLETVLGREFPTIQTVDQIDASMEIKFGVRASANNAPVGCVMCERKFCDSM
jgi:hypothetical protein